MADSIEKKESVLSKHGGWFGLLIAAVAGMFLLDQGEIFEQTLPAAWTRLKQVVTRGSLKAQKAYWSCAIWLKDTLKLAKWITFIWWAVAGIFLGAGVLGKSKGWSDDATLALRLIGSYLFVGYWFTLAMLAKPLYYGMHALKKGVYVAANAVGQTAHHWLGKLGIETPVPELTVADAEKIEAGAKAFQGFFFTITSIAVLFSNFFAPSGNLSTGVYLLAVGLPLAALAVIAAKLGKKTDHGWLLLGITVLISFILLSLRLFAHIDILEWLSNRTRSEKIIMALAFFPTTLWIVGAFWKSHGDGCLKAAKRLTWVSLGLLAFLAIRGTLTAHEALDTTKETATKMQKIEDTAADRMLDGAQKLVDKPADKPAAHPSGGSGATYQAPPSGGTENRSDDHEASKPKVAAQTRIHRKIAVPQAEAPKEYKNPAQGLNALDELDQ